MKSKQDGTEIRLDWTGQTNRTDHSGNSQSKNNITASEPTRASLGSSSMNLYVSKLHTAGVPAVQALAALTAIGLRTLREKREKRESKTTTRRFLFPLRPDEINRPGIPSHSR
ncbi:hypothetical protein MHYP_G00087990 [Metynnis hypsauchen]